MIYFKESAPPLTSMNVLTCFYSSVQCSQDHRIHSSHQDIFRNSTSNMGLLYGSRYASCLQCSQLFAILSQSVQDEAALAMLICKVKLG